MAMHAEWFDKFFGGLYGQVLANTFTETQTRQHVAVVKRLLRLRKGQRVLDVPCGMGRLTIPLARQGLAMTGVDLTASYLRRARRQAERMGMFIRFLKRDMREITFESEFDAVFNWFGSFGYFSESENLRFAKRAFAALKPGGSFLVEGMSKSWILGHFRESDEESIGDVTVTHRRRWDEKRCRVCDTWVLSDGVLTQRHRISMRVYDGPEMRSLLRTAGFCDVHLFGYPPLGKFSRHSCRLIAVAKRPARNESR